MQNRITELDYLKCIFIILMIIFHLVYIGDKYPYAKNIVYTFHMSSFLVISGYLANIQKPRKVFFYDMLWIFIPYAFMENSYVLMSSILPVRGAVQDITPTFLLYKTLIAPMGPYWYLHTLMVCSIAYYLIYNNIVRCYNISSFIFIGLCLFILSYACGMLSFSNAIYFLAGIYIRQNNLNFLSVFQASPWAVIPLIILCSFPSNLDRGSLSGIVITFLAISLFLSAYSYINNRVMTVMSFIGRNTLVILLFSPIFTILSKILLPFFSFDPTGILFTVTAVIFVISGCLGIAGLIDYMHLTRYCFGKNKILCSRNLL